MISPLIGLIKFRTIVVDPNTVVVYRNIVHSNLEDGMRFRCCCYGNLRIRSSDAEIGLKVIRYGWAKD